MEYIGDLAEILLMLGNMAQQSRCFTYTCARNEATWLLPRYLKLGQEQGRALPSHSQELGSPLDIEVVLTM
jgi:hypothetical protein